MPKNLTTWFMNDPQQEVLERTSNFEAGSLDQDLDEKIMPFSDGGVVKVLAATPLPLAHNLVNTTDSGVQSQQSLNHANHVIKPKVEILQPEIKELLSSCAQYNVENNKNPDGRSAELLEEIRHAEFIESIRAKKSNRKNSSASNSLPQSPLKARQMAIGKDEGGSLYENNSLSPDTASEITPMHMRKSKLGHSTMVTIDQNGSPIMTLLKSRHSQHRVLENDFGFFTKVHHS